MNIDFSNMKKLEQQPNQTKILATIFEAWKDIKDGFMARKDYFTASGIVFTITVLFLNAGVDNLFLRRIQALFLIASFLLICWLIFSITTLFFKGKHVELYYAIILIFVWIGGLLIVNLVSYLNTSFNDELAYYLKWLGIPIIALVVNLLSIYTFRIINKSGKSIEGNNLETFFLISLNVFIGSAYAQNNFDFILVFEDLMSFRFGTLFIIYIFLLTIYEELYLWDRLRRLKSRKNFIICVFFYVLLIFLPLFLNYILPILI